MSALSQILNGTPWWVWVIFIYVMIVGIKALSPRVVSLYRLTLMPLIFVALSVHTLWVLPLNFMRIALFVIFVIAGIGIGFWQISRLFIEIDRNKKLLAVPGSPMTLILVLIVFASKYYFGYTEATNPGIIDQLAFILPLLIISGLCTGTFIGRGICYICRFVSLPHKDLLERG